MQDLPAMRGQCVAELLADRAERDAVDDRAVAGLEANAQMRLSDLVGEHELMRWQRQNRLGIAAAEGTGAIKGCHQLRRRTARGDRAVNEELVDMARLCHVMGQRI